MSLSYNEVEIIKFLAEEFSDTEIAERLNIDRVTVKITIDNLMAKTGTKSVVGLMKEAMKRGWIV